MKSSANPTQRRQPHADNILSIDDACLIHIFSFLTPLPDLFNAARTCKRFHSLALSHRNYLVVTGDAPDTATTADPLSVELPVTEQTPRIEYRQQFTKLCEAVEASRPGDTILLEPGRSHTASGVIVTHPLNIKGGGTSPGDTVLSGVSTSVPVVTFNATGKLGNLTIEGGMAGCVAHAQGRVAIENCVLQCHANGLRHLASPLLALATTSPTRDTSLSTLLLKNREKNLELLDRKCGAGFLSVVECQIKGGGTAVRLCGTGSLRAVRVIYEARKALFWFEVDSSDSSNSFDSSDSGHPRQQGEQEEKEGRICTGDSLDFETMGAKCEERRESEREGGEGDLSAPSWVTREDGCCRFDPRAFQRAVGVARASSTGEEGTIKKERKESPSSSDEDTGGGANNFCDSILKKSELWRIEHAHCIDDCEGDGAATAVNSHRKRRRRGC